MTPPGGAPAKGATTPRGQPSQAARPPGDTSTELRGDGAISPLAGLRVLDFTQNLAGPFATQILGDLGADVIKVEPPGGDPARRWGPPFVGGNSHLFQVVNRNKRGVILDLKTEGGRARALELAAGSDVVLQALRRGVAERLGIGYEAVRAANPGVIYVSVTSHGPEGPLADDPGYDPLMQARSGLMSVTGDPDGDPARVGTSIVDMGTGMWTAIAVMGALTERERTGRGCHVTASLLDTALAWMSYHMTSYLATGALPQRMGTGLAMIAPYQGFPCTDGSVMIAAGNDVIFRRLCNALELDLAEDPDFGSNALRVANSERLAGILAEHTRRHSTETLLAILRRHQVPAAPIHTVASALEDPQTVATGMLRRCDHPTIEDYVDIPLPVRWDGRRAALRRHPPDVGEHQGELFPEDR
ncbi:MAG: CoA transferase [Gemmatimonadetes bacterium]|nr:CoA transferase [Gemmatimonadota bacterium]MYK67270.1 CoA transferase [Gemmatimonadota bacterium]